VPHIGWRPLRPARDWRGSILQEVRPGERAYFVHSFSAEPTDAAVRLADVDYDGRTLCAAVQHGNLTGCQFHPERSAQAGLGMLQRFLSSCRPIPSPPSAPAAAARACRARTSAPLPAGR
jgi:glutamine amidotransferase